MSAIAGLTTAGAIYYAATAGDIPGAAASTRSAMVRLRQIPTDIEDIFAVRSQYASSGGWHISINPQGWVFGAAQDDGTMVANFTGHYVAGARHAATGITFPSGRLTLDRYVLHHVIDGLEVRGYVNGVHIHTGTLVTAHLPATGVVPYFGRSANAGVPRGAESCEIMGGLYATTVHDDAEILAHARACLAANEVIEGDSTWTNHWSLSDDDPAPATLVDLIGAVDFTLTGTPDVVGVLPL